MHWERHFLQHGGIDRGDVAGFSDDQVTSGVVVAYVERE